MPRLTQPNRLLILSLTCLFLFGFGKAPEKKGLQNEIDTKDIATETDAAFGLAQLIDNFQKKQMLLLSISKQYADNENYPKAELAAQALKKNGKITPQYIRSKSHIAVSYAKNNQMANAISIIEELDTLKDKDFAYEYLILYLIHNDLIGNTLLLIENTQNVIIKSRLQSKIAAYYIEKGLLDDAQKIITAIESTTEREQIFSTYITVLSKTKDIHTINPLLSEISNQQLREKTTRSIVQTLASRGIFDQALDLVNTIQSPYEYQSTLILLIKEYASTQKFETAYQLSESLKDTYKDQGIAVIAEELAVFGEIENAVNLSRIIVTQSIKNKTLSFICITAGKQQNVDLAFDISQQLKNTTIYEDTVIKMAAVFGTHKEYLYPNLLLRQLDDDDLKMKAFASFSLSYSKTHTPKQTQTVLNEIHDELLYSKTINSLLLNYTGTTYFDEAIELASTIPIASSRCSTLLSFGITSYSVNKDKEQALLAVNKSTSSINEIKNTFVKNQLILQLADFYLELGEEKIALSFLDKAEKYSNTLESSSQKDELLLSMIPVLIRAGEDEKAIKLIEDISNEYTQIHILLSLETYGISHNPKYAKLYRSIVKTSPISI